MSILLGEKTELHHNLLCKASILRPRALIALINAVPENGLFFCCSILLLRSESVLANQDWNKVSGGIN